MRKSIFMGAALAGLLALGACQHNDCKGGSCPADGCKGDKVYTGVLPGADVDGIRYLVKLDYDDDHNYTTGDYKMIETYIQADSTSVIGYSDKASFRSKGDFTVVEKDGKTYLKLVPKPGKYSSAADQVNFWVASDSTLVMVNNDLEAPNDSTGLNYTLKLINR